MAQHLNNPVAPLSPYYLHPNENPSLVLVQPPLTGKNYHSWSRAMRMALLSKNKFNFINGNLESPDADSPDYPAWEQCNNMVLSWLLNSVSASIAQSVMWLNSARDVWNDLKERFSHGDHFRLSDPLEEINSVKQNELSITDYYTNLKILWEELLVLRPFPSCTCNPVCSCGAVRVYREYFESECIIRFLKGLNDHYAPVKSQVMLMTPLPTINQVFGMAIKHERQLSYCLGHANVQETPVMAFNSNYQNRGRGYNSANAPSSSTAPIGSVQYPQRPLNGNRQYHCTYCNMQGHTEDRCYRKHGFPSGGRGRGRNNQNNREYRPAANQVAIDDVLPHDDDASQTSSSTFTTAQLNELRSLLQIQPANNNDDPAPNINNTAVLSANFDAPTGPFEQEEDWFS